MVKLGPAISLYRFEFRNRAALVTTNPGSASPVVCQAVDKSVTAYSIPATVRVRLHFRCVTPSSHKRSRFRARQAQTPMASAGVVGESGNMLAFATNIGFDVTL